VITDEFNTSKLCNECHTELCHPVTHHTESLNAVYKRVFKARAPYILRDKLKWYFKKNFSNRREFKQQVNRERESYGLCCCKSIDHTSDNRLQNRDDIAGTNIRNVMLATVLGKILHAFNREYIKKVTAENTKKSRSD
jgi:hypothetical protein